MNLEEKVREFISAPFPLWENELTDLLVQSKLLELKKFGLNNPTDYSTLGALKNNFASGNTTKDRVYGSGADGTIYLESPSAALDEFYNEHGLAHYNESELAPSEVIVKLQSAIGVLQMVTPVASCIQKLVRSIEVLKPEGPEFDTGYSHPAIPFSIFVSVCEDCSPVSNLRVAESILHEAMHLKLTLIESRIPLLNAEDEGLYYSPWRKEKRPSRGVLHGLFVFTAVYKFYEKLTLIQRIADAQEYLEHRLNQIQSEIGSLKGFHTTTGLTQCGANFVANLLPLN